MFVDVEILCHASSSYGRISFIKDWCVNALKFGSNVLLLVMNLSHVLTLVIVC